MMHGRQLSFGKSIAEDWQADHKAQLSDTLSGQALIRARRLDVARLSVEDDSAVLQPTTTTMVRSTVHGHSRPNFQHRSFCHQLVEAGQLLKNPLPGPFR